MFIVGKTVVAAPPEFGYQFIVSQAKLIEVGGRFCRLRRARGQQRADGQSVGTGGGGLRDGDGFSS